MAQTRGSSQHFILHGLFRLGLLKEKPWWGPEPGGCPGKGIRCHRKWGRALENREVSAKWEVVPTQRLQSCSTAPTWAAGECQTSRATSCLGFSSLPDFISGKAGWKDWLQAGGIQGGSVEAPFIKAWLNQGVKSEVISLLNSTDSFFLCIPTISAFLEFQPGAPTQLCLS